MLHNQARKDLGLRPLCVDLKLTRAAGNTESGWMIAASVGFGSRANGDGAPAESAAHERALQKTQKAPALAGPRVVAGAGFEPATFGL